MLRRLRSAGVGIALLAVAADASAQPYPSHPITFIVPYGAGGPTDTVMRTLTEAMRRSLGEMVIIENVTGASGTLGVTRAVHAPADGYTVSVGNWPTHVINGAIYPLSFDLLKDFDPVARLSSNPYVILGRKDLPARDLKELIAWLKANPNKATEGTAGPAAASMWPECIFRKSAAPSFSSCLTGPVRWMCFAT